MHAQRMRSTLTKDSGSRGDTGRPGSPDQRISLKVFFALAFGLGWGIAILMLLFQTQIEAVFGEISGTNPVFILVVYSPAIAGIYLVWRHYGVKALGSFFRRLTMWRLPMAWWLFVLLGIPAVKYLGAAFNGTATEFPFSPWYDVLPALAAALLIGPVEEFGWRGVALPLLQRRFVPLAASLILGAFWGLWHLPAFMFSGTPQSAWSFGPFLIGVMALAVILTPIFNAARGSMLFPILFHFLINGPMWPEAQPWENFIFAALAVAIVALNWQTMTTRGGAATEILTPGAEDVGAGAVETRTAMTRAGA
ncbi:MAG TPA: type II CAAX endopeptidase family protein [Nitrolancea sp.]|nr:type II CAAX endopeptidase family protein [Nitrolancea sp.]